MLNNTINVESAVVEHGYPGMQREDGAVVLVPRDDRRRQAANYAPEGSLGLQRKGLVGRP